MLDPNEKHTLVIACTNEPSSLIDKCMQRMEIRLHIDYLDHEERQRFINFILNQRNIELPDYEIEGASYFAGMRSHRNILRAINQAIAQATIDNTDFTITHLKTELRRYGSDYNEDIRKKCKKYERSFAFNWQM